ncbi:MAG TPA: MarR family transcriptional regulator [Vicinamibacterales bacterium]|nr:MarR family transcriptional regulator [Vicinamibacterales bacterium]
MTSKLSSSLGALIDEAVALFHRMRVVAEEVHGEGEFSAARRGVLRSLARLGPQTVPQIASARPVSRQHIQTIVDGLATDGLVETIENPAHKRSVLVRLTAPGRTAVRDIAQREAALLASIDVGVPAADVERATAVLKAFREALENRS